MNNTTLTQQLTDREIAQALGISRMTVWRWTKAGRLPQPRKLGAHTTRWDSLELVESLQNAGTITEQDRALAKRIGNWRGAK